MDRYIKFDIRKVAYIPLFFLFLPAFCVLVGNKAIPIFFIVNVIFFIILITFFYKKLFKHLIFLYKNTPFKYFTYWSLWIMLSGIILIILGKYTISRYLYYMILYLLINMVLPLLLPTIIFYKKSIVQNFIKIFFIALTIIFILGIINFIATLFSINILNKIFSFIVNQRELRGVYYSVGIRAQSVFAEPGWFAGFICFNLPIIYSTINSKYKIFNNTIINLAIKKIMIPLVWINIILTKSPIWLIFCLLITILYNIKNIKNFLLKYFHKILILIVFISILVSHLSVNNTYLNRIQNTVQPLSKLDYNTFSIVEPSLASRITSYYNSLRLFLDYPITGIGLGNGKFYMS